MSYMNYSNAGINILKYLGWFDLDKFGLSENPKLAGQGLTSIFLINILGTLCAFIIPIVTLILIKIYLGLNGEKIDKYRASIRQHKYLKEIRLKREMLNWLKNFPITIFMVIQSIGFDLNLSIFLQLQKPVFSLRQIIITISTILAIVALVI